MTLTNIFEARSLSWLFTDGSVTRPTEWYIGLSSTTPNEDGTGFTPPSDDAYERVTITFGAPAADANGTYVANTAVLEFPESTENQGVLTYGGVFDAQSGGNLIDFGPLRDSTGDPAPITVGEGQIVRVPIGAFRVYCD